MTWGTDMRTCLWCLAALVALSTVGAGHAATITFNGATPDNQNVLSFSDSGFDFTAQANLGRNINQSGSAGLGVRGGGQEGSRIAGTDILTITFSQAVFISDITFSEFQEGIETATILLNGVTPNTFILAEQGSDGFGGGGNNSRQTFQLPEALLEIAVSTLQISGSAVNPDGNAGIRLRGFTIENVPLPASALLILAAVGAISLIGRRASVHS